MTTTRDLVKDERDQFAFHDDIVYLRETGRGLSRETVEEISKIKDEPDWMLQARLRAFEHFQKRPMPMWTDGLDKMCDWLIILDDTEDDAMRRQLIGRIMPRGLDTDASGKHVYRVLQQ